MLVLMCESCQIRVPAYDAWVEHVLSDQHQSNSVIKKLMVTKNVEEIHTKGLLAVIAEGPNLVASMVAWHVSNFGLLCDLYYGANHKYVIFHLDSKDCNEAAQAGTTEIDNSPVVVEWVSVIPVAEWDRLFGPFRKPHQPKTFESKISLPPQYFGFIETIFHQETLSPDERVRRHVAINDIANIIQEEYPQATFHPFGSYVTSLGNADSSLNLFVGNLQVDGESSFSVRNNMTRNTLEDICRFLTTLPPQKKNICNGISIVSTPDNQRFIQFMHRPTSLWGNIFVRNPLPVQRSKLIAFFMTLDERVRPFLQLVRYWGRFHGLTAVMPGVQKPTVMRNYALMLLAIVFLENVQIIPTVQALQMLHKDQRESCQVGPWEASFCENKEQVLEYMEATRDMNAAPKSEPNEPLTNKIINLAHEFFNRIALLEPNSLIVCSLLGRFKPKYQFYGDAIQQLPDGMERYKIALESGAFRPLCFPPNKISKADKSSLSMVVQDPFELTANVTEHLSSDFLIKFRIICSTTALAFQRLISSPGQRNNLGTAIKDLFTPVPAIEINPFKLKAVIGELMSKRRETNLKQPRQERSNGFPPDAGIEKVPIYQNQISQNPPINSKFDSYYEAPKPKPLMSINLGNNERIPGNFVPPLIPSLNQSTAYPLPLLGTDYTRREGQQVVPPPSEYRNFKGNIQPLLPQAPKMTAKTPLAAPPPPPPVPIVMDSKDSVVTINVDSLYESIFKEAFAHLDSVTEEGFLEAKKNTLWLLCFSELILSVWHKCFKLNDVLIRDNDSDSFVKHIFPNEIFELMDLTKKLEDEPECKKRRNSHMQDTEDGEINEVDFDSLWRKVNKIPEYPNVFETTFECFASKPFFNGRQEIARWMTGKNDRNPLEREEEITRKVLVRCIAADLSANITIKCSVAADMNKLEDQIVLNFHESFEKSKMNVEDLFFQRFFSLLIPEYAIFRLCQLLEIPNRWQLVNFNRT